MFRIVSLVLVAGCMPKMPKLTPEMRSSAAAVKVMDPKDVGRKGYVTLGEVKGISCVRSVWQDPSSEAARDQLRIRTAQKGGEAVINVMCQEKNFDWAHFCSRSVTCTGDAVVWK